MFKLVASSLLLLGGYCATKLFGIFGMAAAFTATALLYMIVVKHVLLGKIKMSTYHYIRCMRPIMMWAIILICIVGLYTIMVSDRLSALAFLVGEALIFIVVAVPFIIRYKIININTRSFSVDSLLSLCQIKASSKE
jgi:hypothetical protein